MSGAGGAHRGLKRIPQVYRRVRRSVEDGIQYLLDRREMDPYRDFTKRIVYEGARGFRRGQEAPTFEL